LLGENALGSYDGYNAGTNARITQEFSAAAFRLGHSIVSGTETKLATDGTTVLEEQSLADAFSDTPAQVETNGGVDALLRGIVHDNTQADDVYAVDELRNLLSDSPDVTDLIAIDVQRERDLGLGTLNQTREALGLPKYMSFAQVTSDPTVAAHLQQVYGSVDNLDLFIGGLAEDHVNGGMVGSTFETILIDQFTALRDGDSFWWQNEPFDAQTKQIIANRSLSDIIGDNTNTPNGVLPNDVFVVTPTQLTGTMNS
ncbi:MAG TPA: peroxidase family protein, partial [Mycobacterium sp.]|nr:peroxidase family protein [Mycobacterium sp.]